ncbi:MAG: hypothetical protein H0V40_12875 [Actinobacteria bacterium]|nr:hypothetical protein [Actinomycetota bacterium]
MARPRYAGAKGPLPPPLPPETRTVGQLVAEALKLYGRRFWRALALGVGPAALGRLAAGLDGGAWVLLMTTAGGVIVSASYVGATALAAGVRLDRRAVLALAAGVVVFVPFPFLVQAFILPGLLWLALVGLVVPVVLLERRSIPGSFRRALELGRADLVHALGTLATLAITVFLTQAALFFLLRGQGEQAARVAAFLASLVISPLLFLGAALLYDDQAARVGRRRTPPPAARAENGAPAKTRL